MRAGDRRNTEDRKTTMMGTRSSLAALALGNFVIGLSMLAPAGMMADLSSGLGVTIGAVGLLISLGDAVV
jgi:predicted MFS family arabinose efflux permease